MGEDVIGSIGLYVEKNGQRMHLIWPFRSGGREYLRYVQLDETANPILKVDLLFEGQQKSPRLTPNGSGDINLVWARRLPGETKWSLWFATFNREGDLINSPHNLTDEEDDIGKFEVVSDQDGGALIAWESRRQSELYISRLNGEGDGISRRVPVTPQGSSPSLFMDEDKRIHISWLSGEQIVYANISLDRLDSTQSIQGVEVVQIETEAALGSTGDIFSGPLLGYADDWVYLTWSVLPQNDTDSGTASTEFTAFEDDNPERLTPSRVWILSIEEQPYLPYQGNYTLSQVGPVVTISEAAQEFGRQVIHFSDRFGDWVDVSGATSDFVMNPFSAVAYDDEVAIALTTSQEFRHDIQLQIAVVLFSEGHFTGYSIASKTNNISDDPVIVSDADGNLYLAWREGSGGKSIYFATTAPITKRALNSVTTTDLIYFMGQAGIESIVSVAFLPVVGFFWLLPGFLLMVFWKLFKVQETVNDPSTWPFLTIAIAIYYVIKFFTLPTLFSYVPFSAWLSIPDNMSSMLRVGIPLGIFAIAFWVAYRTRHRASDSAIIFYVVFCLTDAFLTLIIYGVNFLGAV